MRCGNPNLLATMGGGCFGGFSNFRLPFDEAPAHVLSNDTSCMDPGRKLRVALIHVGKCGGTSLSLTLKHARLNFTEIHGPLSYTWQPADFDFFIVAARDPIERTVSSLNYMHPEGGFPDKFPNNTATRKLYDCFQMLPGAASAFGEALGNDTECGFLARQSIVAPSIGSQHLSAGFDFYLNRGLGKTKGGTRETDLLSLLRSEKAKAFVIRQEHFEDDLSALMQHLCLPEVDVSHVNDEQYPRKHDTYLSDVARKNLAAYLFPEYQALQELGRLAVNKELQ